MKTPSYTGGKGESNAQHGRFTNAARQLGAHEDEAAFKAKLAQIARQKPRENPPKSPANSKDDEQ